MKNIFAIIIVSLLACGNLNAVVYGVDNRTDIYELNDNQLLMNIAKSTAAMIPYSKIASSDNSETILKNISLGSDFTLCHPEERFYDQPALATCSGFLVAPNILVTAGHCIFKDNRTKMTADYEQPNASNNCLDYLWVFDYAIPKIDHDQLVVKNENIYKCKQIISAKKMPSDDYAIIELDRETNRNPLKIRSTGKIPDESKLYVIGHPSGLPTKYTDNATVNVNNMTNFFNADLDSFAGNSGSPVFNADTHLVEGILMRGYTDYIYNTSLKCHEVNICQELQSHYLNHTNNLLSFNYSNNIITRSDSINKSLKFLPVHRLIEIIFRTARGGPINPDIEIHTKNDDPFNPSYPIMMVRISLDHLSPQHPMNSNSSPLIKKYRDIEGSLCGSEQAYRITNIVKYLNSY